MKQYILRPEEHGNLYRAKIPHGIGVFSVCYVTESDKVPQRINYQSRLELGHDYQINNGYFVSRRAEFLKNAFVLVQVDSNDSKKCKTCRKDNEVNARFCSSCGSFLF